MMFLFRVMMMTILVVSRGQINKRDVDHIVMIYNDMESDGIDMVTEGEIFIYFSAMSNSPTGTGLNYYDFDYWWGPKYSDGQEYTAFLYSTWNVNDNNHLDVEDLQTLFSNIDTNGSNDISLTEFAVYMEALYAKADANIQTVKGPIVVGR